MNPENKLLFFFLFLLVLPIAVNAHILAGETGFSSGIIHPVFGIDHLLAMVAVGIISTQFGPKAVWVVPAAFVFFMVLGGIIAIAGISLPAVETWIALSVLVLGVMISFSKKVPLKWAIACIALFAIFHGHAHGEELPVIAEPILYIAGFVFSTVMLHISGVLIGHFAKKTAITIRLLKAAGTLMSITGILFLFGAL